MRRTCGPPGAPHTFMEMPSDVLYEIVGYLEPRDLLSLAQTSKPVWFFLTQTPFTWEAARARVDPRPPDRPDDLSEAKYAGLLFRRQCTGCGDTRLRRPPLWAMQARWCDECIPKESFSLSDNLDDLTIPREIMQSIIPSFLCRLPGYEGIRYPLEIARSYDAEFRQIGSEAQDAWVSEKIVSLNNLRTHQRLCATWWKLRAQKRMDECNTLREKRYEAIVQRLSENGWGDEISWLEAEEDGALRDHDLVSRPKALTDRIWKNMSSTLVSLMETTRSRRIAKAYLLKISARSRILADILFEFAASQPLPYILGFTAPLLGDVAAMLHIRFIIEQTPDDVQFTRDNLKTVMSYFYFSAYDWIESTRHKLIEMMKRCPAIGEGATSDMLDLATTFFRCQECDESMRYPHVTIHRCIPNRSRIGDESHDSSYFNAIGDVPWNYKGNIHFDLATHNAAKAVLVACMLDLGTRHRSLANDPHFFMACLECSRNNTDSPGSHLLTWDAAVFHVMRCCPDPRPGSVMFRVLNDHERQLYTSVARDTISTRWWEGKDQVKFICRSCRTTMESYNLATSHLWHRHQSAVLRSLGSTNQFRTLMYDLCFLHPDSPMSRDPRPILLRERS